MSLRHAASIRRRTACIPISCLSSAAAALLGPASISIHDDCEMPQSVHVAPAIQKVLCGIKLHGAAIPPFHLRKPNLTG